MHTIKEIDDKLTELFADFEALAASLNFAPVCNLSDEGTIREQKYSGLYLIEVRADIGSTDLAGWIKLLRTEWEHDDYKTNFTSNFKDKRIKKHSELVEWMPFYIGKSENVGKRVKEHITLKLENKTYALKLNARPAMKAREFRLSTLKMPVTNYSILAPKLEEAMRDKIHPLIGRQ